MLRAQRKHGEKATEHGLTIREIEDMLQNATKADFEALSSALRSDTRAGVIQALKRAQKRIEAKEQEESRLNGLYEFELQIARENSVLEEPLIVGLDEVGRGPMAGPLTIGACVLPHDQRIAGLNDSKQVSPARRKAIADQVRETAIAWATVSIPPEEIDAHGMSLCLRKAFAAGIAKIESQGIAIDVVLLDGNPLGIDKREVNMVKGDARCASIAAASIIAKVERDAYMESIAPQYPAYHFEENKGYGSAAHLKALGDFGLTPIHRRSFCGSYVQTSLF